MKDVPPIEVSRLVLLALVAGGAIVAIATAGDLSRFAGGFAAGAGSALVLSRARRDPDPAEGGPHAGKGSSA
jgi:hypothetical protein